MSRFKTFAVASTITLAMALSACGNAEPPTTNAEVSVAPEVFASSTAKPTPTQSPIAIGASPAPSPSVSIDNNTDTNTGWNPDAFIAGGSIDALAINPKTSVEFDGFGGEDAVKYAIKSFLAIMNTTWSDNTLMNVDEFTADKAEAILRADFTPERFKAVSDSLDFVEKHQKQVNKWIAAGTPFGKTEADRKMVEEYKGHLSTLRSLFLFEYSDTAGDLQRGRGNNVVLGFEWEPFDYVAYPSPDGKEQYLILKLTTNSYIAYTDPSHKPLKITRSVRLFLKPTLGNPTDYNPTGVKWLVDGWDEASWSSTELDALPGLITTQSDSTNSGPTEG